MTCCHVQQGQVLCQLYLNIYFSGLGYFLIKKNWGKTEFTMGRLGYLSHSDERDFGD